MQGRQCDVLVFGDSTAMTGVNPDQVQAATGLRTCNIAVTNAVLAVTDDLPLNQFLAHNARPQVLLLQFSPDDLQRESHAWTRTIYAEGLLELLRHGSGKEIQKVIVQHPRETIAFAGYVAGYSAYYGLRSVWSALTRTPMEEETTKIRNGFFTPPMAARTSCDSTERRIPKSDLRVLCIVRRNSSRTLPIPRRGRFDQRGPNSILRRRSSGLPGSAVWTYLEYVAWTSDWPI